MNRKKEKRGRRSPCGPLPQRERFWPHGLDLLRERDGHGRDFGGQRLRYIAARESDQCMDLVKDVAVQGIRFLYRCAKRVISRDQSIQLESLILAQSERWRQA